MTDRDLIQKLRDALGYILEDDSRILPRATSEAKKHIRPIFEEADARLAEPAAQPNGDEWAFESLREAIAEGRYERDRVDKNGAEQWENDATAALNHLIARLSQADAEPVAQAGELPAHRALGLMEDSHAYAEWYAKAALAQQQHQAGAQPAELETNFVRWRDDDGRRVTVFGTARQFGEALHAQRFPGSTTFGIPSATTPALREAQGVVAYMEVTECDIEKDGCDASIRYWGWAPGRPIPADEPGIKRYPLYLAQPALTVSEEAVERKLRYLHDDVLARALRNRLLGPEDIEEAQELVAECLESFARKAVRS